MTAAAAAVVSVAVARAVCAQEQTPPARAAEGPRRRATALQALRRAAPVPERGLGCGLSCIYAVS